MEVGEKSSQLKRLKNIGNDPVVKIRLSPGFQKSKTNRKKMKSENFQKTPLKIVAEKLHAKYEGAAMIESWLNGNLKLPLVASGQEND